MKFGELTRNRILKRGIAQSPIEKTHLHFCKRYLKVSNKASNAACRGELGRLPLIVGINEKILNYIMYLFEKDEDSIVKQALLLCNFNIARVNQLRFQRDFSAIYRAITCDLSPRFTKHGNFEQQFRYSAGAHVLFWFEFFSFCFVLLQSRFVLFQFCFVSFYNSAKTSN